MKRIFWLCMSLSIVATGNGQIVDAINKRGKKNRENPFTDKRNFGDAIWSPEASQYRPFGWYFNPGITYMVGNTPNDDGRAFDLDPSGLPGYYLEGGANTIITKKYGNKRLGTPLYINYGLGIKHFGGQEKYTLPDDTQESGSFNFGNVFGRFAFHGVIQIGKWNFLDQSIGLNVDYRIYGGDEDPDYNSPEGNVYMDPLVGQLHYSLGWGIKIRDGFYCIPMVQTPILTLLPWNDFNPGHTWFQSRYQPLIFTLKFAWLRPNRDCPTAEGAEDDDERSKKYQNQ